MTDLGGGHQLHRRPGTLLLKFLLLSFLLLTRSTTIQYRCFEGDSVTTAQAQQRSPPTSATFSSGMAHGRSQFANTVGRTHCSSSPANLSNLTLQCLSPSLVSVVFLSAISFNTEMKKVTSSDLEILLFKCLEFRSRSTLLYSTPVSPELQIARSLASTGEVPRQPCISCLRVRFDKFQPPLSIKILLAKVEVDLLNFRGTDSVPDSDECFASFPGLRHRQLLPTLNRHCSRLCTASRIDFRSRIFFPTFARNLNCVFAELSTGTMARLSLTGTVISSTPDCSTTVLCRRQSTDLSYPYTAAAKWKRCELITLIWEKGFGPSYLEVESPFADDNAFVFPRLRPREDFIGFLSVGYFVMSKYWTMFPIKLSM